MYVSAASAFAFASKGSRRGGIGSPCPFFSFLFSKKKILLHRLLLLFSTQVPLTKKRRRRGRRRKGKTRAKAIDAEEKRG